MVKHFLFQQRRRRAASGTLFGRLGRAGQARVSRLSLTAIRCACRVCSRAATANKRDVPYQSLIKIVLQERIDQEFARVFVAQNTASQFADLVIT